MDVGLDLLFDIRVASVLIAIVFPIIIYRLSTRNHDYWSKRGVPNAKPYPVFGSLPEAFTKSFENMELDRYNKLGRIYGFYEGSKPQITVGDPEILRNILVKDFHLFTNRREFDTGDPITDNMVSVIRGEEWKRVRTIISPTFSTGKIKRVMGIFQECARTVLQNLKMESAKKPSVDVLRIYGAFTMDVIASSAFSTKIDSHNNPENNFVKMAKGAFNRGISPQFILFFLVPKLMKFFGLHIFGKKNTRFFKSVTLEIIEERKRTGQTRNDFLQLLMDTADETEREEKLNEEKTDDVTSNYGSDGTTSIFKTTNKRLSKDELVAQCVIFFLAGYHTTATTLGICSYLLSLNPEVQEKVFKEIKETLSETNGELTYDAVQKMKYLDNVISETLRLYSSVLRLERQAETDYKLGDTGITIPKGMVVGIPVFAMHRDPKLFPEPEKFDPDRFSPERRESMVPYSYLPFGAGPRNCVGMRFALVEMKVCLVHVLSVFKLHRCAETKVPLELGKGLGLLAPLPIHVRLEERKDCPLKV